MTRVISQPSRVPVVDLAGGGVADPDAMAAAAAQIALACRTTGFFYVVNHGVPAGLCRRVMAQTQALFDLPNAQKCSLDITKSKFMRGYFGHGQDRSDGVNDDVKEGFDLAADLALTDPLVAAGVPFYGPNVWPASLPAFKPVMNAYHRRMMDLGLDVLAAIGRGLGVEKNFFAENFRKPIAQLRLLRYPPPAPGQAPPIGAGEHTDFGWITMILQDGTGGLEIRGPDGGWIAVPEIAGSFVVNIGDLLQRWTNDHYLATLHRVVNASGRPRYSAAFFMDPDYHAQVECLPGCVSPARPANYRPILVGDYMARRFAETTRFGADHAAPGKTSATASSGVLCDVI
jgi:isopenicillin N synthase-like dioxygenase